MRTASEFERSTIPPREPDWHFLFPRRRMLLNGTMTTRRKIIVYIATSADGYIARPDGDVEWLNRRPDNIDYGMKEFYPTIDTILWGRKRSEEHTSELQSPYVISYA